MAAVPTRIETMFPEADLSRSFVKWFPSELMEWAKSDSAVGRYNLARSGVPSIKNLTELPGGPFVPDLWGHNEWGHPRLKETVAGMYGAQPDNVLLAQGASQCNFLIAGAALSGGGTAIVETPVYQPILRAVQVWADRVIRLPRRRENLFQPEPDELRRLITNDTRLIALTNLHNPSHVAMDEARLRAIVETAADAGAAVMIDEVFLPMLDRNHGRHGFASSAISINSLGKSWGLDAIRVGWAVGPAADLIHTAYRLNNLLGVNQPYMTEDLALRILENSAATAHLIAAADKAAEGRVAFERFLRETPEVDCVLPSAGISALVELPPGVDDRQLANELLECYDTVVFPGAFFDCPGSLRVSFGDESAVTTEGLRRLTRCLRERHPSGTES